MLDRCVFAGDMGATRRLRKAQAECIGKPMRRQLCGVPLHGGYTTLCTNSLRRRCALKKKAAEDKFIVVEVRRIQQFLWFRFSKDTNAELKLPKATQKLGVSSSSHFLVEDAMCPISLKWIWNSTECFFCRKKI